jgi:hypothetical protein
VGSAATVSSDPYTLANEITTPASTTVNATILSTLGSVLTNGTAYLVTYSLPNGTFANVFRVASNNLTL